MRKTPLFLAACAIAITSISIAQLPQNPGPKVFPSPLPETENSAPKVFSIDGLATNSPALPFIESAQKMVVEERFPEAKEALKTALRLEPMSISLWARYDDAVISDYIDKKRRERQNPVVERDINPIFSINRIDSYIELGTLYVVGSLQNLSKVSRQKIQLTARILDENKRELRSETGTLRSIDKGLFPNESSLFEIAFKNPPLGAKTFRVEVTTWE